MARPRKPSHLKAVQGTERKDRANPSEPVASTAIPVAPDYLSPRAVEKFLQLCAILEGMGIASRDDNDALSMLAGLLVEIEEDAVLLDSVGAFYMPSEESGIIRAHPAVGRIQSNRQRAQALLGEFGLTPAARSKVSAGKPKEANPFAALG
ncbi:P27 family phage terminase small subunit [Rhodobacteraceae bacterium SC52]|nr:P27 family phage terminase small subunit [Rhodobacteraceae bacterium SC52]